MYLALMDPRRTRVVFSVLLLTGGAGTPTVGIAGVMKTGVGTMTVLCGSKVGGVVLDEDDEVSTGSSVMVKVTPAGLDEDEEILTRGLPTGGLGMGIVWTEIKVVEAVLDEDEEVAAGALNGCSVSWSLVMQSRRSIGQATLRGMAAAYVAAAEETGVLNQVSHPLGTAAGPHAS